MGVRQRGSGMGLRRRRKSRREDFSDTPSARVGRLAKLLVVWVASGSDTPAPEEVFHGVFRKFGEDPGSGRLMRYCFVARVFRKFG